MTTRLVGPRLAAGLALLAVLPSCGGGTTNPPPPPTPTPAPVTINVFQATFPPLNPGGFAIGDFAIPGAGAVRATMDWTFPSNQMFLFVFAGTTCTEQDFILFVTQGPQTACTLLGSDLDPSTKPGLATFNASATNTTARVIVLNLGPTGESGVVVVTLTR